MSVIASTDINNTNDEVLFDRRTFDKLQTMDIEELVYDQPSDEENKMEGIDIEEFKPKSNLKKT